jgi:hypothetical protein
MAPVRPENRVPECIAFGAALSMLRLKSGRRQYEVAAAEAMLSAYETGASYPRDER